jgi:hypothetical protein
MTNATITGVFVSNELSTSLDIEVLYHSGNGVGMTSAGTISVVSAFGGAFPVNWSIPINKQLAVKVISGSPKNIICGLSLTGNA